MTIEINNQLFLPVQSDLNYLLLTALNTVPPLHLTPSVLCPVTFDWLFLSSLSSGWICSIHFAANMICGHFLHVLTSRAWNDSSVKSTRTTTFACLWISTWLIGSKGVGVHFSGLNLVILITGILLGRGYACIKFSFSRYLFFCASYNKLSPWHSRSSKLLPIQSPQIHMEFILWCTCAVFLR